MPNKSSKTEVLIHQLHELEAKRIVLMEELEKLARENRPLIRGTVVEKSVKCGKKKCRCTRGELHKRHYLSVSIDGQMKQKYIRSSELSDYLEGTKRYQQITEINLASARNCAEQKDVITLIRDHLLVNLTPPPSKRGRKPKSK